MFLDRLNPLETMCFSIKPTLPPLGDIFPDRKKALSDVPKILEQFKQASSDQKRKEAQLLRDEAGDLDGTAQNLRQTSAHWSEMVKKHSPGLGRIMRSPQHPAIPDALDNLRRTLNEAYSAYPEPYKKAEKSGEYGESDWDFADRLAGEMHKLAKERQSAARHLDGSALKDEVITSIKHVLRLS